MKLRIPKVNTYFRFGLLFLIIKTIFGSSNILRVEGLVDDLLSAAGAVFLFLSVMKKGCKPAAYFAYLAVIAVAAYSSYRIGNLRMLMAVILCVAASRQNMDETVRFLFSYEALFLLFHVLIALATSVAGKSNAIYMSGEMKYTFGFGHPNVFSCLLTNVLLMWSWINYDRLRITHILFQIIVVLFFYLFTGTRTILISIGVFSILIFYYKASKKDLHLVVRYFIPIVVVFHLIAILMYLNGYSVAMVLDKLLSKRITLGAYWFEHKGLSIFGQNLNGFSAVWDDIWQLSGELTFDNLYTFLLINNGIIWLVVLSILFWRISFMKNRKYNLFLIVWALYGVTEVHGVNPVMLFPVLLLASGCNVQKICPDAKVSSWLENVA